MKREISNTDDVIDSRDIEKRIYELESERDSWQDDNNLPDYIPTDTTTDEKIKVWTDEQMTKWVEWEESDEGQELKHLTTLRDDLQGYCADWRYGATLIRESYWVEYCKELVKDVGDMPKDLPSYIESNINWDGVADDLQVDYTSGDYDGVTYWAR